MGETLGNRIMAKMATAPPKDCLPLKATEMLV